MEVKLLILKTLDKKGALKVSDIVKATGFSRTYVNRFFEALREEGRIVLVGKANRAFYVPSNKAALKKAKKRIMNIKRVLINKHLSEDIILEEIKRNTGIFLDLPANVLEILEYAFTEILNNAIEHSSSKKISVVFRRDKFLARFDILDFGVGIFTHIKKKKHFSSEMDAVQELMKGKETTMPTTHSGEGIFFTSKAADTFFIKSSTKKLIFNNLVEDVFLQNIKKIKGTRATFVISLKSKRNLRKIFQYYSDDAYEFSKTKVLVKLYKSDSGFISRSQARRVVSGLNKFKTVILDFRNLNTVGRAFADEVFRVWQSRHPRVRIEYKNADKNIEFMIKKAWGKQ